MTVQGTGGASKAKPAAKKPAVKAPAKIPAAAKKSAVKSTPKPKPTPPVALALREKFVEWLTWGTENQAEIHYLEFRPMPINLSPGTLPLTTDCSGYVTICAKWAGAPDPNGSGFDGEGFTGTMLDHCKHIASSQAQPGDLIVYGSGSGQHVVGIVKLVKDDFLVASHGQESDPVLILNSVEKQYHQPVQTFLRFLP